MVEHVVVRLPLDAFKYETFAYNLLHFGDGWKEGRMDVYTSQQVGIMM
jgi:hypothetical protein